MRFERALHAGLGRRCNALEHTLLRLRPRRRSAGRKQRDPAFAHHELIEKVRAEIRGVSSAKKNEAISIPPREVKANPKPEIKPEEQPKEGVSQ